VLEHFRRKVAGECSTGFGATILRTNAHRGVFYRRRKKREQRRGRAYHQLDGGERLRPLHDPAELRRGGAEPVHLPISRHEWVRVSHFWSCVCTNEPCGTRASAPTPEVGRAGCGQCCDAEALFL